MAPRSINPHQWSQRFCYSKPVSMGQKRPTRFMRTRTMKFATAFIFNLLNGGPVATRTPDLYRVKVKQPLQDQQQWLQVVDSTFHWMGQIGPIVRAMGHKGPKFCASLGRVLSQLGNTLRTARLQRGWSMEDLASACGFSTAYLRAVEAGQADPSILAIAILFDALGLGPALSVSPADDQA